MSNAVLHIRWSTVEVALLHGFDNTTQLWTDEDLVLGLANPNLVTAPIEVFLRSNAAMIDSQEILNHVRIYLAGAAADLTRLLEEWPATGNGLEVSFDGGRSWTRFSTVAGNPADPSTWIPLPGVAISSVAADGQIGPMDTARLHLRLNVGAVPDAIFSRIRIGIDCDVL